MKGEALMTDEAKLRQYAKQAQASMAIEGYIISDEESERYLQEYINEPEREEVAAIADEAKRRGLSVAEAVREYFRKKNK